LKEDGAGKILKGRINYVFIFKEMPTTYRRKNYERGRWEQESLERARNAFKVKLRV
jgi:hypothetical protein